MIKKKKRVIGVTAVAAVIVAASGVGYALVDTTGSASNSGFCADMPDSIGLYVGNPVTQMGYQVGRVEALIPKGDHVQVDFSLTGGRRYPADVKAVTRSKSLLADRSLELVGNYGGGSQLVPGRCIDTQHSFTPKSISQIAGSAADFIDALAPSDGKKSLENAVAGMDDALRGNGQSAAVLMQHASGAMSSPDQLIADVGASIVNMAPLTEEALQRWATIKSILNQAPSAVHSAAYDLFPGVINLTTGMDALIQVLYDIQRNYGGDIWPVVHGGVTDSIHLAATHSRDLADLLESIPQISALLRQQAAAPGGLTMSYEEPTLKIPLDSPLCGLVNRVPGGACRPPTGDTRLGEVQLLDLIVSKAAR
ncbi:MlaD family protein [Nocardia nova]|uniref:MlaD family protein n=1 Tax=Nocardia nova TaxID=37330 RepID=UPI0037B2156B